MSGTLDHALYDTLNVPAVTAVAPGGVHRGVAPPGTTFPYVVLSQTAGDHEYTLGVGTTPALSGATYLVKVIDAGLSAAAAQTALAVVDGLLNGQTLTLTSGTMLSLLKMRDVEYDEEGEGVTVYQHVGHEYDIVVDPD